LRRKRESQARWYAAHGREHREKHLASNRAHYQRNREAILERLRLKRKAAKEARWAAEEGPSGSEALEAPHKAAEEASAAVTG